MSAPRSVRFDPQTLTRLAAFVGRHPGLTSSSAAALLVEEGLRMDAHPGVLFRGGPSGRRASVVGGPDIWEIVRAIRDTRAASPELRGEEALELVSENTGVDRPMLHIALAYYGAFPDEIDATVSQADDAEAEAERALAHSRGLLDA